MKKLLAAVLALTLTAALAACGGTTANVISNGYTLYVGGTALAGTKE